MHDRRSARLGIRMASGPRDEDTSVEVTITALGEGPAELRSLREWLVREEELRGRVTLIEPAPRPGTLGSVVESLLVMLGPGGTATALASVLITWIRHRSHEAI